MTDRAFEPRRDFPWSGRRALEDAVLNATCLPGALEALTVGERLVLGLRFGLAEWPPLSLRKCGALLGVSREQVRLISEGAFGKMRAALN